MLVICLLLCYNFQGFLFSFKGVQMKLGISTACFYLREHVEATFEILHSMGVDTTEVFLNTFSEYEKSFVEALKERKGDIRVHSLHAHGTCFEPEFAMRGLCLAQSISLFTDLLLSRAARLTLIFLNSASGLISFAI